MTFINQRRSMIFAVGIITLGVFAKVVLATHSWGGYHWARQTPQFALKLGNNMSPAWQPFLTKASSDWNSPTKWLWNGAEPLLTAIVAGQSNRNCRMVSGTTQVCNASYGFNGWLGLA